MQDAFFFGYGSLVNCDTHGFAPVRRARVRGWKRAWRATAERQIAYLTAIAAPDGVAIDGLTAPVPQGDWAALDAREQAYDRHDASQLITHLDTADGQGDPAPGRTAIYAIAPDRMGPPTADHPILLSYLDVVIQGYLRHFGPDGVARFVATTEGWDAPVLNDRAAPLYPRAQRLTAAETGLVDTILQAQGSRLIRA